MAAIAKSQKPSRRVEAGIGHVRDRGEREEEPAPDRDQVEDADEVVGGGVVGALLVEVVQAVELRHDHPGREAQAEDEQLDLRADGVGAAGRVEDERASDDREREADEVGDRRSIRRTSQPRRIRTALVRRCSRICSVRASTDAGIDELTVLEQESDPVVAAKKKFIADHGLIVWRFHDLPHTMKPDMITKGIVRSLGWESNQRGDTSTLFAVQPTTLENLASTMSKRLNSSVARMVGNPEGRVSRVALTQGFPGFTANRHAFQFRNVDVLVIGEDHEWESIEYAVDAISAGQLKGLIVLGHISSEQSGMEETTRSLKTFITEVPIEFVPTKDTFKRVH